MERVQIEVEIQGDAWLLVCKPWPYKVGRRWLTRFVKILGGLAGGTRDVKDIGVDDLLDRIPETTLDALIDECEKQTACVGPDGKAVPFAKLSPLLATRYDITLRLVGEHLRLNFGPFFSSLGSVLADLTGAAAGADEEGGGI